MIKKYASTRETINSSTSNQPVQSKGSTIGTRTEDAEFFLRLNTQFSNLGDALINRELVGLLSEIGPVTLDPSKAPKTFLKAIASHQVEASTIKTGLVFWLILIKRALISRRAKAKVWLLLNPGGYTGEITPTKALNGLIKIALFKVLKKCGVSIAAIGLSYEDLGPRRKWVTRIQAKYLDVHAVRDQRSLESGLTTNR